MKTFIKFIHCCNQEEIKNEQVNFEYQVPIKKENGNNEFSKIKEENENNNKNHLQIIQEKKEPLIIDSSNLKLNDNNNTNTMNTLSNTFNTTNNNIIIASINNINNNLKYNLNTNVEEKSNNENKNIIKLQKDSFTPSKKRIIYSNSISHKYFNINKAINNNFETKNNLGSIISKSKASKNNMSNHGSILTLNNLILTSQIPEEKISFNEKGSKILLSGELFFWKDIIMTSNGIKNSLRKEKDDHVYFGIKNIPDNSGEPYNDLIVNFIYQEEDSKLIETNTGRIFEIFYNKKIKEYILRFLHPNLILYSKMNSFIYFFIGKFYYFLLGSVFISISVKKASPIEKIINIQVDIENNKPLNYSFSQNQAPINIGRVNCEINIFNSSISKRHGIIEYSKNSQTFYYNDLGSTNGSTLIIKEGDTFKIKGEMNFKLEDVSFKIQEIP